MEVVIEHSIDARVNVSMVVVSEPCWLDPVINSLAEDRVPVDGKEAGTVRRVLAWYWLLANHKLCQRSFRGLYLQCLQPRKVDELLTELHEGVCDSHVGGHSLVHRAMTQVF